MIGRKLFEYKNIDICDYLKLYKNEQINDSSEINHWQSSCFLLSKTLSTALLLNFLALFSKIIVLLLNEEDKIK